MKIRSFSEFNRKYAQMAYKRRSSEERRISRYGWETGFTVYSGYDGRIAMNNFKTHAEAAAWVAESEALWTYPLTQRQMGGYRIGHHACAVEECWDYAIMV